MNFLQPNRARFFRRLVAAFIAASTLLACGLSAPAAPEPQAPTETALPPSPTTAPTSAATVTPEPSPSPEPTATSEPPKILYQERFDDENTCFRTHTFESGVDLSIEGGEYTVRVDEDTVVNLGCQGGYYDFVMDFEVTFNESNQQSLLGVSYRIYVGTSYNLYLTGSGEYCWDYINFNEDLYRILAGCWEPLPAEIVGAETITVRIMASEQNMAVLLNGAPLALAADPLNDYGSFSFFVAHEGAGATEIVIDNIVIREIIESDLAIFRSGQTGY